MRSLRWGYRAFFWALIAYAYYIVFGPRVAEMLKPAPAPVGPQVVTLLHPTRAGIAVRDLDASNVWLRVRRDPTPSMPSGVPFEEIRFPWRARYGHIKLPSVPPGGYSIDLVIDPARRGDVGNKARTGELEGGVALDMRAANAPRAVDVAMIQVIHMLQPVELEHGKLEASPKLAAPIRFAWEPVPRATSYEVHVLCRGGNFPGGVDDTVTTPSWVMDMGVCHPGTWQFSMIAADAQHHWIGSFGVQSLSVEGRRREERGLEPAGVVLRPTFGGKPLAGLDARDVVLEVDQSHFESEERHGKFVRRFRPEVRVREGRIEVPTLAPDHYSITAVIDTNKENGADSRGLPGDLLGEAFGELATDWGPITLDLELVRVMRLRLPGSNEPPYECCPISPRLSLRSPITFEWDPLPEAGRYEAQIKQMGGTHDLPKKTLAATSWRVDLVPSDPNHLYGLEVLAYLPDDPEGHRSFKPIGQLNYWFAVER